MIKIDARKLRVALAERDLPRWRLAKLMKLPPSTLSDYLRGARPAPPDLAEKICTVLGADVRG
jgi:plasmid maintenance system antidote protein VapI